MLKVVAGDPSAEELAALTVALSAVLAARGGPAVQPGRDASGWADRSRMMGAPAQPGSGRLAPLGLAPGAPANVPPSGAWRAHIELTRLGTAAAPVSAGRVALNALTGNRLEPSSASSVRIRPSSAANLPACPAPAQTSTRCDPGT